MSLYYNIHDLNRPMQTWTISTWYYGKNAYIYFYYFIEIDVYGVKGPKEIITKPKFHTKQQICIEWRNKVHLGKSLLYYVKMGFEGA